MVILKKAQFYFIASIFLIAAVASYFFTAYHFREPVSDERAFNQNCFMLYNELNDVWNYCTYHNLSYSKSVFLLNQTMEDFNLLFHNKIYSFIFLSKGNTSIFLSNFNNTHILLSDGVNNVSVVFDNFYNASRCKFVYLNFGGFIYNFSDQFSGYDNVTLINVFLYSNKSGQVNVCYYSPSFVFN